MYNEVIKLVSVRKEQNRFGDLVEVRTERQVFAKLLSIGSSEFYQAAASGMKPEVKFVLADYLDYNGEQYIRYLPYGETKEREYSVIRQYRNGNQLELTCQRGVDT